MAQQETALESFDVQDREFRRKREEWIEWLFGEDPHSISRQIEWMTWDYLVFRVLNESRRIAARSGKSSAALNPMIVKFIDNGFIAMQALAIRKLVEGPTKNGDRKKEVISLLRLVTDMKEKRYLLKRADQLPKGIFEYLEAMLKGDSICKAMDLVNKRIAHAADPFSRQQVRQKSDGLSFAD